MKKLYNSPEVVITTFNTTDNTNIVYVSAIQSPKTSTKVGISGGQFHR